MALQPTYGLEPPDLAGAARRRRRAEFAYEASPTARLGRERRAQAFGGLAPQPTAARPVLPGAEEVPRPRPPHDAVESPAGALPTPAPSLRAAGTRRKPREAYSFYDEESRQRHPFVTALVANAVAGREGPEYVRRLNVEAQERRERAAERKADEDRRREPSPDPDYIRDPATGQLHRRRKPEDTAEPSPEEQEAARAAGYVWSPTTRQWLKREKPAKGDEEVPEPSDAEKARMARQYGQFWDPVERKWRTNPLEPPRQPSPGLSRWQIDGEIRQKRASIANLQKQAAEERRYLDSMIQGGDAAADAVAQQQAMIAQIEDAIRVERAEIDALESMRGPMLPKGPLSREQFEALPDDADPNVPGSDRHNKRNYLMQFAEP